MTIKRQFKVRVWDPETAKFTSWDDLIKGALGEDDIVVLLDSFNNKETTKVIQEYTNNLDKHDGEIYEGDLILWGDRVGEVCFEEAHWVMRMRDAFDHSWYLGGKDDKIEIVGNIFEGQSVTLN